MGREQWGHGYWAGIKAAQDGVVKVEKTIRDKSLYIIAHMRISNEGKYEDRSLYPVNQLVSMFRFNGLDIDTAEESAKEIYDYIMRRNPLGCYISGSSKDKWTDDFFVLPNIQLKDTFGIIRVLEEKWAKEEGLDKQWEYESELLKQAAKQKTF